MIVPLGTRVLVKPDKEPEITSGGLYLTAETREKIDAASVRGVVIDVGEFAWLELQKKLVEKGDYVIFAKWGGFVVKGDDKEDYRLLNDGDILAVIK